MPKFGAKPKVDDLNCLLVGKNVDNTDIQNYLREYFRRKGMMEAILRMKLVT